MTALLRAALAGAATGGRSFTGLAALALATPSRPVSQPDRTLSSGWVKGTVALLAVGELALDKLPQAPSRLTPPSLGWRCLSAAAAGLIIARRALPAAGPDPASAAIDATGPDRLSAPDTGRIVACAAAAAAAAVGASLLGARWRGWAAERLGRDYVGAGLEDVLTISLAGLSVRPNPATAAAGDLQVSGRCRH